MGADGWPEANDYAAALAGGRFDLTPLLAGTPTFVHQRFSRPVGHAGSTAVVYPIQVDEQVKALRLFTRRPDVPLERYRRLAGEQFEDTPIEVPQIVPDSVVVDGQAFPALVGPWIDGPNLDDWVDARVDDGDVGALVAMRGQWLNVVGAMQRQPIAHGDLQHGNVLVVDGGRLEFVDLDGVWTPSTADLIPIERGHENYQHPRFAPATDWNRFADTFPAAVINLGLAIACEDPAFWQQSRSRSEDQMVIGAEHFADLSHPLWESLLRSRSASIVWATRLVRDALTGIRPPQRTMARLGRHDDLPAPPGLDAPRDLPPEPTPEPLVGGRLPVVPDRPGELATTPIDERPPPPVQADLPTYLRRARGEQI